jgi:hypothetical protein
MSDNPHTTSIPRGWKLVPIKPTNRMIEVGKDAYPSDQYGSSSVAWIFEAMALAAPEPTDE